MAQERVQKIMAQMGIASRRNAEALIKEGVVTINGKVAKLGDKAELGKDAIKVKGKLIQARPSEQIFLAFYKPKGVISMLTDDAEGRPTLKDYIPTGGKQRIFPVGRLDYNGEGLILLTNDGEIAEKLQKSDQLARVYQVKIKGHPTEADFQKIKKGAKIDNKMIRPSDVKLVETLTSKSHIELTFTQSGSIDIRAFLQLKGFLTEKTVRVGLGTLSIDEKAKGPCAGLKPGQIQPLTLKQVEKYLLATEA